MTMVTTQFTGCTFCFKNSGGTIHAAHIAPSNKISPKEGQNVVSIDPTKLAEQLADDGNFSNADGAGNFHVYGRDHGKHTFDNGYLYKSGSSGATNWMTVIGFRTDVGWAIFTQSHSPDHATPVRVRKLYPAVAEFG